MASDAGESVSKLLSKDFASTPCINFVSLISEVEMGLFHADITFLAVKFFNMILEVCMKDFFRTDMAAWVWFLCDFPQHFIVSNFPFKFKDKESKNSKLTLFYLFKHNFLCRRFNRLRKGVIYVLFFFFFEFNV